MGTERSVTWVSGRKIRDMLANMKRFAFISHTLFLYLHVKWKGERKKQISLFVHRKALSINKQERRNGNKLRNVKNMKNFSSFLSIVTKN